MAPSAVRRDGLTVKLRAPPGCGAVSIAGRPIAPDAAGDYEVSDWPTAQNLMASFGFTEAVAAPSIVATPHESVLRAPVMEALGLLGITAPADAGDALLGHALIDAVRDAVSVRPTP